MRRLAGQALRGFGRFLRAVLTLAVALLVVAAVCITALAWRLSEGPINLEWAARRLEAAANEGSRTKLHIGAAALAWEGWHGIDQPLDLRLADLSALDPAGEVLAEIPKAELALSFAWLLVGRIVPRAVALAAPHVRVTRAEDGALSLDLGSLSPAPADPAPGKSGKSGAPGVLAQLSRPPQGDRAAKSGGGRWSQLRRVRITDAAIEVTDRKLGTDWRIADAGVDLSRPRRGGVNGTAALSVAIGGQTIAVSAKAELRGGGTTIRAQTGEVAPARLAAAVPGLAALAAADLPVRASLRLELDDGLGWTAAGLEATFGAGELHIARGTLPVQEGILAAEATPERLELTSARLALAARPGAGPPSQGSGPTLQAHGEAHRDQGGIAGRVVAELDRVPFAELARYWPEGVGGGGRAWVTQNITAGIARAAHAEIALRAAADGSDPVVVGATAHVTGEDLTVHWLRPVPPAEHAQAQLTLQDPDAMVIAFQGGRQSGPGAGANPVTIGHGSVRITGLAKKDQDAAIEIDFGGGVPEALALLRHPRLHLLSAHPVPLHDPAGKLQANLTIRLPLQKDVSMEQIDIHAAGRLDALHLARVVAGRDLDQGKFAFDVTADGLKTTGTAKLAGIGAEVGVDMDFRAGPPSQVTERYSLAATASIAQLAAAGIDLRDALSGSIGAKVEVKEHRSGAGEADVALDLAAVSAEAGPLGWRKQAGAAAGGTARVLLDHDRITGIESLEVEGDGVAIRGHAEYGAGQAERLVLERFVLGRTRAQGEVVFARTAKDPIAVTLSGTELDLAGQFGGPSTPRKLDRSSKPGQAWVADLHFERVRMARGAQAANVVAHAEHDGSVLHRARLDATLGAGPLHLQIVPQGRSRRVSASATDIGALLRATDVFDQVEGGTFALNATYNDARSDHMLSGTAEISGFRLRDAPVAARVLEGMTLYGLLDAMRGPGLGVSRLVAPFHFAADVLELQNARAFSPSLGVTAKGRLDLGRRVADLDGTIVPAYFFNTLLGRIPLVGRLFSPEKGGGVFAATFAVNGRLDNPSVSVNPLAALTPGFLRGIFDLFDEPAR